jgi:hypothetical protein
VTYYKATQPDGKSFHASPDGTRPIYVVGYTYEIPENERKRELCSSGVLHASDTPSETLIGGSWPCRLFEVEGTPVVGPDSHKYGFYSFDVVREIEPWRALGPNGLEVAAFIEAVNGVDSKTMRKVGAAWVAAWAAARDAARAAASDAASAAARYAAWVAAWDAANGSAWNSARDAALALCARDLITEDQFATLYAPWADVIDVATLGPWDSTPKAVSSDVL